MPTASTAQILGNNESIEPYTSNIYTRRVLSGEFQVSKAAVGKSCSVFISLMIFTAKEDKVEAALVVAWFREMFMSKANGAEGDT